MNILIVDDEPAIADTLSYALRAEGFATECCTLGSEALARLQQGGVDFVVLDVGLPDITGFDVCRALRREHTGVTILNQERRSLATTRRRQRVRRSVRRSVAWQCTSSQFTGRSDLLSRLDKSTTSIALTPTNRRHAQTTLKGGQG